QQCRRPHGADLQGAGSGGGENASRRLGSEFTRVGTDPGVQPGPDLDRSGHGAGCRGQAGHPVCAVLNIPARKKGSEMAGTMVFTGLMSAGGAPGAYGVYVPAKAKVERELKTDSDGASRAEEEWEFKADNGSSIEVKIEYVRGPATRN